MESKDNDDKRAWESVSRKCDRILERMDRMEKEAERRGAVGGSLSGALVSGVLSYISLTFGVYR